MTMPERFEKSAQALERGSIIYRQSRSLAESSVEMIEKSREILSSVNLTLNKSDTSPW